MSFFFSIFAPAHVLFLMSGFCIANRRSLTARSVLHRPVCQSEKRQTRISMRTLARKSHAVKPLTIFSVRQISLPNQVYRMCADCWQRFRRHHNLGHNHRCDSRFYSYLIFTREVGLGNCWFLQVLARNVPCIICNLTSMGGNRSLVRLLIHQRTWIPAYAGTTKFKGFDKFGCNQTLTLTGITAQ
jgi:hypothetical protein